MTLRPLYKLLALAVLALLATSQALGVWSGVAQADCLSDFGPDLSTLRADVGDSMGRPTACEQPIDSGGDTVQATSTGTAWYTISSQTAIFTDGYHRWDLEPLGLTYWASPGATPLLMDGLTEGPAVWTKAARCPVLYTHEVPPAATFRRFLSGLLQAGFQPLSLAVVDAAMSGQGDLPPGCLVLTFDDALASQLRNAVPVLTEFNITATFFVMPAFQDGVHQYLDASGIRALHDSGQMIGAHTCNHPSLPSLSALAMLAELGDCRHMIENIIGVPVRYFAYPNGAVNQPVLDATARAGYRAAFTTRAAATLRPDQPLLLPRIRYDISEAVGGVVRRIRAAQ